MAERAIQLTEEEIQRMEAILLDRDEEEALRFLKDVIKEKLRVTGTRACGPKPVSFDSSNVNEGLGGYARQGASTMSSSESLFQLPAEGSLQLMNLIERALKAPSFKDFADDVLSGITQLMQTSKAFLFIADPRLSALHFAQQGFQPEVASKVKTWCIEGFEQICYKTEFPQFPESFYSEGEVFPDFMLHLLRDDAKYMGLIGLNAKEGTARISPDVLAGILKLLAKVANRVSERAELEKQLSYLNTYLTISSMLTQSLGLHELLEAALNCSMEAVSADAASVLILDDEKKSFHFYQVEGPAKPVLARATFPADKGVAGSVLQARRPELINDLHSDPRFLNEFDSQTGFRTRNMIAIPLLAGEEAVGVLEVLNKTEGGRFTKEELMLMASLAEEMAFAIRNAKIFEYVANTYCRQRQGQMSCKGCKRPLGSWTPCVKHREACF